MNPTSTLDRLAALDLSLCLRLRALSSARSQALFVAVSRAGDGWLWLALAALLALVAGAEGRRTATEMLLLGAVAAAATTGRCLCSAGSPIASSRQAPLPGRSGRSRWAAPRARAAPCPSS